MALGMAKDLVARMGQVWGCEQWLGSASGKENSGSLTRRYGRVALLGVKTSSRQ
jgi:hypothetical protein